MEDLETVFFKSKLFFFVHHVTLIKCIHSSTSHFHSCYFKNKTLSEIKFYMTDFYLW